MAIVRDLADRSLLSQAKTWYVGANVEGKAQGLTLYTGGFARYREACLAVAAEGYRGLAFEPADATVAV